MAHNSAGQSGDLVSLLAANGTPSEDGLSLILQQRFRAEQPYTRLSSTTLVVVNPLRPLSNLSDASAEEYKAKCYRNAQWEQQRAESPEDALPPHPYELAARVYHMMERSKESQSVVFGGMTDSGKSYTSKLFTQQLLRLSASSGKRELRLAEQVKSLDVLLNSFGSAKTKANGNASRHGRYLELHYDRSARLSAAKVLTFGLEKRRVNRLAPEERTFHVFYQLLAGASADERDALKLDDVTSYALLASSGCYRLPGGPSSDDAIAMDELRAAMKVLGFKQKQVNGIFTILSAILLLGNLEFGQPHEAAEASHVTNRAVLDDVADLLGVPAEDLELALTSKSRFVRRELVNSFLGPEASAAQRDSLMRDLYATLFAFVVETANHKIAPGSDEAFPTHIVQLDAPGFQSRASGSIGGAPPGGQQADRFEEFAFNTLAELVENWSLRRTFDDSDPRAKAQIDDGVCPTDVAYSDNSACVELLRGSIVGTSSDRMPGGLLGVLDAAVDKVRSGAAAEDDDASLLNELDRHVAHGSYVASRSGAQQASIPSFGVKHYQGTCSYAANGFVERDLDLFDSAFVQLLRRAINPFVAKLFAGPSLATESHPLDANTIVTAQVSVRPLRRPTPLQPDEAVEPLLDSHKVYGVTRQLNACVSEILATMAQAGQIWNVTCLRPNDISQPGSFDSRRVKSQVKALALPEMVARKKSDFVYGMPHDEFCLRYSDWVIPAAMTAGVSEEREKVQAFAIANALRDGIDFRLGNSQVWLSYPTWRRLEDRVRSTEPDTFAASTRDDDEIRSSGSPTYPPDGKDPQQQRRFLGVGNNHGESDLADGKAGFDASAEDLLLSRPSNVSDPFRSPGDERSLKGGAPDSLAGWGSEYDKRAYGEANAGLIGTLEKDGALENRAIDAVEEIPTTAIRRWWVRLTWLVTWWIPSFCLSRCGGMKRPDVQMAWREKFTICFLIAFICGVILFYVIVFGRLLCPDYDKAWTADQLGQHAGTDDYYAAIHGTVYDFTKFYKNDHSDIANLQTDDTTMLMLAGQDLTNYFPVPLSVGCQLLVTDDSLALQPNANNTPTITQAVHTSGRLQGDQSSKLADPQWYPDRLIPYIKRYRKGYFVYTGKEISRGGEYNDWATVNGKLYDLTDYMNTLSLQSTNAAYKFLDSSVSDLFKSQAGQDITGDFHTAMNALNETYRGATQACLDNVFYRGRSDFRDTPRCQVQNYLLLAFSLILVATILAKFVAALQLGTKRNPEQQDKFVICQVPCYTEGEDELRKTIDSLAGLQYDDKRKLLFLICDGMIVGSGNERPTPRIVLDILGVDPKIDPEPLMFKSVAEGSKQLNYGKVYSGLYEFEGHVVPYIVVVKVGRPSERSRPGNRGKRDTQILLMRYLNRVHFDAPMYPLELEIYHQMKNVIGIDPAFYEYILMVDADTSVEKEGLNRLVAVCADDSRIIAICGETSLDNAEGSWWTMIQVYEYYISHHLSKAFESLFGSVTCLPGCFSMYRIRSSDKGRPLFISNRIIDDYSENRVDTLHKKNLLHLGEDRYLTTLVLKHFPAFRTKFIQDAKAQTAAPDRFGVLLSQRRRWINSTIHNLAELVLMEELCGFCLFSMRFIVFIDLIGTIILPATAIYLVYLIVITSTGKAAVPIISIAMIAAVYGLQAIIFLVKRQWQYIGWLVIYVLAYPVFSFFLPLYSFWHMDDFSWGNTRIVVGEKGAKKIIAGTDDEPYDDSMIPVKKFSEYQRDVWDQGGAPSVRSGMTGAESLGPFGNSYAVPHSGPPSMYKAGSAYAGSAAGSEYGAPSYEADYFRDTNVIQQSHSRAASNSVSRLGGGGSQGPTRMSSMNFAQQPNPSMQFGTGTPSMFGMPAMGSMYGMGGGPAPPPASMYGMPAPGGAQSMYGMPPVLPPMGGHSPSASDDFNRNSTMPLAQQMTGGAMWGQGGMARPQSTFSTLNTGGNPFAPAPTQLPVSESAEPSDEDLQAAVRTYLANQPNLMSVTKRSVREAVTASFPNADLAGKKATINKAIDDTLSGAAQ
ncbi:uncharacterized protein PFL1_06412 [Pseudozyma flocculosa PF-1]|uniref:chitin synthase n=2 Tax=Pseudozyma flocculosa TaxID=84751 RepID=A0A5C3EVG5_9BASI|nr:uncharacterized protein PFL1_06412 [Pseudozyma flocculosa PF-1]EPQ25956.1 hypothetical protein PFL1_06412 [Pseudozyma flocculosa PF-1]SPO35745.1 related to chitin synthase 6 [Pseudozyma flocculosa]